MKTKGMVCCAAAVSLVLLSGCGGENGKLYRQAQQDLSQESYDYALEEYNSLAAAGYKTADSLRGAGISNLHLGNYQDAIDDFSQALETDKLSKAKKKDLLLYRITAYLKAGQYDLAMADCQTLAKDFEMDADSYYLTGCAALALNSYDEAASAFTAAYNADANYEMALQIYETYLEYDMEADGSTYLENALSAEAKDADDYCSRGKIYYYMEDYENAQKELVEAVNKDSTEAMALLGMVYLAQGNTSNARSMYQQYIEASGDSPAKGYNGLALCDIADGSYDSALSNISSGLTTATTGEMQDLLYNEIVVYEKKLDFATAYSKLQEYLAMFPDDEEASREGIFLQSRVEGSVSTEPVTENAEDAVTDAAEETVSGE